MMIMVRTFTGKSSSYSQVGVSTWLCFYEGMRTIRVLYPYSAPFHSRGIYRKLQISGTYEFD